MTRVRGRGEGGTCSSLEHCPGGSGGRATPSCQGGGVITDQSKVVMITDQGKVAMITDQGRW